MKEKMILWNAVDRWIAGGAAGQRRRRRWRRRGAADRGGGVVVWWRQRHRRRRRDARLQPHQLQQLRDGPPETGPGPFFLIFNVSVLCWFYQVFFYLDLP